MDDYIDELAKKIQFDEMCEYEDEFSSEDEKKVNLNDITIKRRENILLKTKSQILRMPNNKQKVYLTDSYFSLLQFWRQLSCQNDFPYELNIDEEYLGKYFRYVLKDTANALTDLKLNSEKLIDKLEQGIKIYKDNEFCEFQYIKYPKSNVKYMQNTIFDFFASLGEDVLRMYCKMLVGRNIYMFDGNRERLGTSYDTIPLDNSCVSVKNVPKLIEFYINLAHEVGHCYQFYLQKDQRNYSSFYPYNEITSTLFENLFLEYLKRFTNINDVSMQLLDRHKKTITCLSSSKVLLKLFRDKKVKTFNPITLQYKLIGDNEHLKREMAIDCGYVRPEKNVIEMLNIHYVFADLIVNYFIDRILNDFDNGWKEFKNFICTVNYLPMDEVIDKYFRMDLLDRNVKEYIKSYPKG